MSLLQWSVNNTRRTVNREGERESQFRPKLALPRSDFAGLFRRSRDGANFINGKFGRCRVQRQFSNIVSVSSLYRGGVYKAPQD